MISDQVAALIEQAKQHKSGESRNSLISRLKDARAHAFVMEREEFLGQPGSARISDLPDVISTDTGVCICPAPGAISRSCTAKTHRLI